MRTCCTRSAVIVTMLALIPLACKGGGAPGGVPIIRIDGSSTVFPITEAVAEEFQKGNKARVTIGVSGTGGGFKKFCGGETDVSGASRPIKPTELKACAEAKIDFIELPVAYDGLAVVVNPKNDWVDAMTVAELKTLWEPAAQGKIMRWSQVRAGWPDRPIRLFGPGVDSGTYDYFTKAVVGREHASRGDFTSSEDDNVLVQGVAGDPNAIGFFGLAYYVENKDRLKVIPIITGRGPVAPSVETVADGTYQPLSRPIFIYVSRKSAKRDEVKAFIAYYLDQGRTFVEEVGYVPLPESAYKLVHARFDKRILGSVFGGKGSQVGVSVERLLQGDTL